MKTIGIILGSGIRFNSFDKYIYKSHTIKSIGIHKKVIKELYFNNLKLIVFQGRSHLYETNNYNEIFYNVNYAKENNVNLLIITNSAGAINIDFKVSDLMLITSHINFMGKFLRNWNYYKKYNKDFINRIYGKALNDLLPIKTGVYCSLTGPTYETRKEMNFLKKIGVDAVGMSTVPEMYLCSRYRIETIGISIITNLLSEKNIDAIKHEDVVLTAKKSSKYLEKLIKIILNTYDS